MGLRPQAKAGRPPCHSGRGEGTATSEFPADRGVTARARPAHPSSRGLRCHWHPWACWLDGAQATPKLRALLEGRVSGGHCPAFWHQADAQTWITGRILWIIHEHSLEWHLHGETKPPPQSPTSPLFPNISQAPLSPLLLTPGAGAPALGGSGGAASLLPGLTELRESTGLAMGSELAWKPRRRLTCGQWDTELCGHGAPGKC